MKKLKVLTVVGTRPEIIRLSCTLIALDNSDAIDHILVHTGQNYDYELNEIFFEDLNLRKPNYFLNFVGNHLGETIGNVISKSYELLSNIKLKLWFNSILTIHSCITILGNELSNAGNMVATIAPCGT